jgi:hypothetical protein
VRRSDLSFNDLRDVNVERCKAAFDHELSDWSLLEWAGAMAGEAGETANIAKKIKRIDERARKKGDGADPRVVKLRKKLVRKLIIEVADTVTYGDLLVSAAGGSLGKAVRQKFNQVSKEKGVPHRL